METVEELLGPSKQDTVEDLLGPPDISQVGHGPDQSYQRDVAAGATPYSYPISVPSSMNPDWDAVRYGPVPGTLPLAGAIMKHVIGPVASTVINRVHEAMSPENREYAAGTRALTGTDVNLFNAPEARPGVPMVTLPTLSDEEKQAALGWEKSLAGIGEGLGGMYESLTTPESIATLPFAEYKPVAALYGAQMAAGIPESLQALNGARTPDEKAKAYTSLALNLGMSALFAHSAMKEGAPNASGITSPEGLSQLEVRPQVGQETPLRQQGEAAPAREKEKAGVAQEAQVPLSEEHAKLLAPHWTDSHVMATLPDNQVMRANHATGQIEVDPVQFGKWVDNDLRGLSDKQKAAAVKSGFEHEDIHLKTDPEDGEPFWNSLSPFEQWVIKRNYLKGGGAETARNLGMEAIRNRVERAMGLTRSDFVGLTRRERWTAKSLDALADVVGKIRRLHDKELSAHQKEILDKVMGNIKAARNAVPAGQAQDESQYVEGPFMRRKPDEPAEGMVRLYRGHDGASGGVYWTKDKTYAERMGPKLEYLDVPAGQLDDYSVRNVEGSGTPNAFKLPPEMTKGAQEYGASETPVHNLDVTADELLKRKPGDVTVDELLNLPDAEVKKLFEGNQKRGNALQYDSVLAGMKLLPEDAEALKKVRDQLHQEGMQKLQEGIAAGKPEMPPEFGKVIWLNGAIEGALRKGPNYESVTTGRRGGPAMRRRMSYKDWQKELDDIHEELSDLGAKEKAMLAKLSPEERRKHGYAPDVLSLSEQARRFSLEDRFDQLLRDHPEYIKTEEQPGVGGPDIGPDFGPSMRRKATKPGEQPEMFGPVTAKGVPGAESVPEEQRPAPTGAFISQVKPQVTTPDKIDWQEGSKSQSMSFRAITPSEAKNPTALKEFLTEGARKEGSDLPVSATKRLTALFDRQTGQVHLVSTYRGDNVARMVDPALAGSARPNRPVSELLHRYTPIYSILLKDPVQNFHEAFHSMADFREGFVNEANRKARELGTGTPGIPMTSMEALEQQQTPFQMKQEREPNFIRPTDEELKSFHDFFGDELPSDADMFNRKMENAAANASRAMINGLRKLVRIERATHRGMSEGEALGNVLDRLYENLKQSETRSEFVQRTQSQSSLGPAEEIPQGGTPRQTGARELSTLRSKAPTTVEGAPRGTGAPMPEGVTPAQLAMMTPEERAEVERQVRLGNPAPLSPTLYRQLAHREVPKERYTVAETKSIQDQPVVEEGEPGETQQEIFPEREMMSEEPGPQLSEGAEDIITKANREKLGRTKEGETGIQKAINKGIGNKGQLDFWDKQGPAMRRKAEDVVDKLKDFLERTRANISTAGNLSDQLYRLKTGEKADYDLALPVIKSALKIIPAEDRPVLLKYADEMQVLKKSDVKLTDAQEMMYQTFLKPLLDENQKMYQALLKAGVPIGESTYLGRIVQDTHSLYSRLWRGTKQRIVEGSILGQGASFFKRRVFKALEDEKGNRQLVALVGTGKDTKVIGYTNGKAELLGKMPPESLEVKPMSPRAQRTQRLVEARRLQELDKLDKEEQALLKEKDRLTKLPDSAERDIRMKGVDDRLASINGDYAEVAEKYPDPLFETPRFWRDGNDRLWRFTDATVGEIEDHTNTRYYKEPMSGIITQHLKLKQIYRANQFLEDLKNSPEFKRVSRSVNERNVPPDWRTVDLQQFRGLRIEPRTADELDLFSEQQRGPSVPLQYVNKLNSFLRNSLFIWNPFVHEPNLLTHWFTARGIEWAKPQGYERMFKSGVAALNDVLTRSRFRDQALRAGAPLLRGMGDINRQVMRLLEKELNPNPSLANRVARGLGYVNPLRMIRAFGDTLTWGTNEILTLQLIRETMQRTGLPLEDAIHEVGKHMPNYRIPPRVLNSRLISHVLRNPMVSLWGHYHYGALRSYGEMAKEIAGPGSTAAQRLEGLGRVATIGFLMAAAYPAMDDLINKVMKTKGLKIRRAGSTTAPSNILSVLKGTKTPEAALQSIVTHAPVTTGAFELAFNRNLRTGLPIYERRLGTQTLKDIGSFSAQKISPVEEAGRVFGGRKSAEEFGLGLAGITRTRADSAMSRFGRMADDWMRKNPDESIREEYKRRTQDVFRESDYQLLRSAVIRQDDRAAQMMVDKLLKTRSPEEVARRIKQWEDSPFTGTRKTDKALMEQMTPEDWDLWYQAAQERMDIANGMMEKLADAVVKQQP